MEASHWKLVNRYNEEIIISKPIFRVGRSDLDIKCYSNKVSRNHAFFVAYPNGTLHVQDNKSANGTYINGQRISPNMLHQLHVNDEVGMGLHSGIDVMSLVAHDPVEDFKYIYTVRKSLVNEIVVLDDAEENISTTPSSSTSGGASGVLGPGPSAAEVVSSATPSSASGVNEVVMLDSADENSSTTPSSSVATTTGTAGPGCSTTGVFRDTFPNLTSDVTDSPLTREKLIDILDSDNEAKEAKVNHNIELAINSNVKEKRDGINKATTTVRQCSKDKSSISASTGNSLYVYTNSKTKESRGGTNETRTTIQQCSKDKPSTSASSGNSLYLSTNSNTKESRGGTNETETTIQCSKDKPSTSASSANSLYLSTNSNTKESRDGANKTRTTVQQCSKDKPSTSASSENCLCEEKIEKGKIKKETEQEQITELKQEPPDNLNSYTCNDYTTEDGCIIINDDDDEFPCSQLFNDQSTSNNNDQGFLSESIFCTIKKELEELDKPEDGRVYACVDLVDSDGEESQDWLSDIQKDLINKEDENKECQTSPEQNDVKEEDENEQPTSSTKPCWSNKKKYVVPPVVSPHFEAKAKNNRRSARLSDSKMPEKRKLVEKENEQAKKIKTDTFYNKKTKDDSPWKRKRKTPVAAEAKDERHEIRKKKLRELTEKKQEEKETKTTKCKTATAKVKVSDSRGKFLTENVDMPSTSRRRNILPNTPQQPRNKSVATVSTAPVSRKVTTNPPPITPPCSNQYNNIVQNNNTVQKKPIVRNTNTVHNNMVRNNKHTQPQSVIPMRTVAPTVNRISKSYNDIKDMLIPFLNWKSIWFENWKERRIPPPIHNQPLSRMSQTFSSYSDYYKTVMPLLELELWNYVVKGINEENEPRKKKFMAHIDQESKMVNYTDLSCYTYITKEQSDNFCFLRAEDAVIVQFVFRQNELITIPMMGYITEVYKKNLKDREFIDEDFGAALGIVPHARIAFTVRVGTYNGTVELDRYMYIRIVASLIPSTRIFHSIKYLEHSLLCQHVLKPTFALYAIPRVRHQRLFSQDNLNLAQYETVIEATEVCLRKEPGIYLIQGPPGTGKSTVIINIIQQILFRELNSNSLKQCCILVVAPSNAAVDELTSRLIKLRPKLEVGRRKAIKLVRLGPSNMISAGVQDYTLPELAKRNILETYLHPGNIANVPKHILAMHHKLSIMKEKGGSPEAEFKIKAARIELEKACRRVMGREWNDHWRKTEESLLENATIICTTLSSCVGQRMQAVFGGSSKKIRCCIVDEATQSTEQETLIPLQLGIDKIVLVGDPKQLPAVTLSKEAKDCAYGQSLFSRIMSYFEGKPNNPIRMLDTQYRMHAEICKFPSKTYYNGKLINAPIVKTRLSVLNNLKPYLVFNFKTDYSNSQEYSNRSEIDCVIKLLDAIDFLIKDSCPSYSIGIVTPYNSQKDGIKAKINRRRCRRNVSISVNTVDSFQGQEKDIIIMSCVRDYSNNFISDEQRLNVAITRAMYALYIIGSDSLLRSCTTLGKIYDDAKRRFLIQAVNYSTSVSSLSDKIKGRN